MEFAANCIYLVFFGIDKDISVATEDNLREYTTEFIQSLLHLFFYHISVTVTAREAHIPGTAAAARDPTPSDEDKQETIPDASCIPVFAGASCTASGGWLFVNTSWDINKLFEYVY
jgi:hypothetical protein